MTKQNRHILYRLLALGIGFVLAGLLGELAIRIVLTVRYRASMADLPRGLPQDPGKKIDLCDLMMPAPDPLIVYNMKPGARGMLRGIPVRNNELGFRDDPLTTTSAPRRLRVVGLGDSSMFGLGVEHEQCYLELLEDEFRNLLGRGWQVDFINTGVPGYNSVQEVETFTQRCLGLNPDAVIIQFDNNDTYMPAMMAKPDFMLARYCFMAHPLDVIGGQFSGAGALYVLGQEKRMCMKETALSGWESIRQAYGRLATLCREKGIPLFVLTIFEDFPRINIGELPDEGHGRILKICRDLKLNVVQTFPRANAWMIDHQADYLKLVMSRSDPHPNPIGHGLIAQALLPPLSGALLPRLGVRPESLCQYHALGNAALRQMSGIGLYPAERWDGMRINWTGKSAHLHFIPAGTKLCVPLLVPHQDASETKPVEVTVRLDGMATADHPNATLLQKKSMTKCGYYVMEFDLRTLSGCPLELSIQVDRVFRQAGDPRPLGVALYTLYFA